jgi:hypothetical protein
LSTLVTNRQSMAISNALDGRPLYRIALEGAWIKSSLDRMSLSLRKNIASLGFRASRTPVELATCGFQSTTATRGTGTPSAERGSGEKVVQRARLLRPGPHLHRHPHTQAPVMGWQTAASPTSPPGGVASRRRPQSKRPQTHQHPSSRHSAAITR